MVQEPNLDTFVVCRARDDVGLVQIGEVRMNDGCATRWSIQCFLLRHWSRLHRFAVFIIWSREGVPLTDQAAASCLVLGPRSPVFTHCSAISYPLNQCVACFRQICVDRADT